MKLHSLIFPLLALTFSFSDPCAPAHQDPNALTKQAEPALEVQVAYPRFQESARLVSALGKFSVSERLNVKVEFSGVIEKVSVGEGDQVNVGDSLCLFKSDDLNRQIEKKQAELKEAQATLDLDRKRFGENPSVGGAPPEGVSPEGRPEGHFLDEEGSEKSIPSPAPTQQPVGDPDSILRLDEAKVDRITTELTQLDDTIKKLSVTTSIAGVVSKKGVTEGGLVQGGDTLFEIVANNPISFSVGLPQEVASFVDKQMAIKVQPVSTPDTSPLDGTIYYVSPEIDASSRTLEIRAHFPNDGGKIKEGDQGKAFVVTHKVEKILIVPRRAVVEAPEGNFIYSIQVGKAVKSPVTIGQDMGNGEVEIQTNIRIDDPVILSGQASLKEGTPVSVVINSPASSPRVP